MCSLPIPRSLADLASVIDACVVSITGIADWGYSAGLGALVLLVPLVVALVVRAWR